MGQTTTNPALADADTVRTALAACSGPDSLNDLVSSWAGEDQALPFDPEYADDLLNEYVCTLADGTILAWGAELASGRDLVVRDQSYGTPALIGTIPHRRDD